MKKSKKIVGHPHSAAFMKWGITGVNRLTGCRELVSGAMPKELAVERCSSLMAIPARRRPYLRLKVVQLPYEEGSLNFKGGGKSPLPLVVSDNEGAAIFAPGIDNSATS